MKKRIMMGACFYLLCCGAVYSQSDVELTGIIIEKGREALALVNGEMVKAGDKIGDVEIVRIDRESVTFRQNGKEWARRIDEEGALEPELPGLDVTPVKEPAPAAEGIYGTQGAISPDEVASLTLALFNDGSTFDGYVVFTDRQGQMRAVNFIEPAYLDIHKLLYVENGKAHYSRQKERINLGRIDTSDFKYFRLRESDVILAYVLKPFYYEVKENEGALVVFKWGALEARVDVRNVKK
ncbi:MAG: hypothetical protein PHH75_05960 [Candidatus Omnitrophica bacterium]|nr:hypothetical protein [Candidatus Omnitrophota bacterium]MDD5574707.1 hypothetical protein [Candidatus Omnitrophota bacterium]